MRMLIHPNSEPVKVGDTVTDFRGDKAIVTGWAQNGRNRVYVKDAEGYSGEYFVSVFDLRWVD